MPPDAQDYYALTSVPLVYWIAFFAFAITFTRAIMAIFPSKDDDAEAD